MKPQVFRLTFIDVIRAFAICMMLQGHFIDGLLAPEYRDPSSVVYQVWFYFRGMTAPVFFTVSGFIFMYLLAKEFEPHKTGWNHIRVRKGIKRGITLIVTAYLLRMNFDNLFSDEIDKNVRMVDVLQCIGLSLLFMISIYLFSYRRPKWVMPIILLLFSLVLFVFHPIYATLDYNYFPLALANYFTKENGSVFTIFPWFGYASFGAFMGVMFNLFKKYEQIYTYAIVICLVLGGILIFGTRPFFIEIYGQTGVYLAKVLTPNHYLFQRLGNVLWVFTFFMLMRDIITSKSVQTIGQNTLSIYIIHYIILYGSFTGIGLYRYFHHQLSPVWVIGGALSFIVINLTLSHYYNYYKPELDAKKNLLKSKIRAIFVRNK